jgi:hypothetical protein
MKSRPTKRQFLYQDLTVGRMPSRVEKKSERLQAAAAVRALAFEGVLDLIGCGPAAAVINTRYDRYPDRGQRHLNDQLNPVNAWGNSHGQSRGDGGANKRRNDTNQEGEPERDVLPTRRNDASQDTDDQANYQRCDDSRYFHCHSPQVDLMTMMHPPEVGSNINFGDPIANQ